MNAIRDTFFEECEELFEALSEGLASLQTDAPDMDTVNTIFRAVHSIKGGAGAFALTDLVSFAHRFENVLDALRSGKLSFDADLRHVLLRSADHLADQVEAARSATPIDHAVMDGFLAALDEAMGTPASTGPAPAADDGDPCFGFAALPLDFGGDFAGADSVGTAAGATFGIFFRPSVELHANGHEPALLIASLCALGQAEVTLELDQLPDWGGINATTPWLAWTIRIVTEQDESDLRAVFEFVEGLCQLTVTRLDDPGPPPSLRDPDPEPAPQGDPRPVAGPPDVAMSATAALPPEPAAPPRAEAQRPPPRAEDGGDNADNRGGPKPTLRVDLEKVDRLIDAVGELIINQAMIAQGLRNLDLPGDADIITNVDDYRILARDIQEAVMAIRSQPVKPLFQRMSRIVREAADATGKSAELVMQGESTEIDKTVIERLADPLTHMIRNAVDHGLEKPADRVAAGKDPTGIVKLSAAHRSGSVIITIRDDGAGLNRRKILEIAKRKGLIPADHDPAEAEIDGYLFLPGFSTADKVSNLSGRGVGLDVVKNAVNALGGRISITSYPGEGTEFTLSLPLTLAVMDGMVISVCNQTMVVPISNIIETIRPDPADVHRLGTDDVVLATRGQYIPMIDVARSLGFSGERLTRPPPLVLLVETDAQTQCALIVDTVHDQRQVVIKGLEANYAAIPGISAATILGDGQIALILDTEALAMPHLAVSRALAKSTEVHAHAAE